PTIHRPFVPTYPWPSSPPNIKPQPSSQKPIVVTANTMKFFERMLTQFFWRQKPDSTQAKPRFMKNTSIDAITTQTVSAITFKSALLGGAAGAGAVGAAGIGVASSAAASASGAASSASWAATICGAAAHKAAATQTIRIHGIVFRNTSGESAMTSFASQEEGRPSSADHRATANTVHRASTPTRCRNSSGRH